ncbi:MAG: hypothetical protein ACRDHP_18295, partial [Ktedonobacterales bacterium]
MGQPGIREPSTSESGAGDWQGAFAASVAAPPSRHWEWWFRLSAPATPAADASAHVRSLARRGRVGGVILLGVLLIGLAALPIAAGDPAMLARVFILLAGDLLALILNRRGRVTAAGSVIVVLAEAGAVASFFWAPQGQLNFMALSLYGLFLVPEMVAATLLKPLWMLLLTAANCLFIVADALTQPRDPLFAHWFLTNEYALVERPVMMQLFVALVFIMGMRVMTRESRRADSAEEIARL